MVGQPGPAVRRARQGQGGQVQRLALEDPPQDEGVPARSGRQLLGDVGDHPAVGGRRGRQHRGARRQLGQQGADAPVVGPEVVTPVGDAVRLVDDQQPGGRRQLGQHGVAEARVVQPLGADQQHVDLTARHGVVHRRPVVDVAGVDGDRPDAGPAGRGDLVAHQRQQRADDHRGTGAAGAQQGRRHEVDRRLAPAGALHDQRAATLGDQRVDGGPLVLAQHGVRAGERAEVDFGVLASGHARTLPRRGDRTAGTARPAVSGPAAPAARPGPPVVRRAGRAAPPRAGSPAAGCGRRRSRRSGSAPSYGAAPAPAGRLPSPRPW